MEILFVSHKYPPAVGGMEKQSFELITGMERHCKVHRIVFDGNESILSFFLLLKQRILRMINDHPGIQVIHFNDGLIAAYCVRHQGYEHLKRTVTLHGLDVVFPSKTYRRFILPRFNRFDKLIAVSRATAEQARQLGIRSEKLVVISNGVDTETVVPETTSLEKLLAKAGVTYRQQAILVGMGRPVKRKGMSWFIREVVPRLKGDFLLLLIGAYEPSPGRTEQLLAAMPEKWRTKTSLFLGFPTDNAPLRLLLGDRSRTGNVVHLGRLPAAEVQEVLAASDAFIMPNIHVDGDMEGFGLVCLEAVMAGATVYAADIDGIPDAIQHGKNGFLLPSGDAAAWAQQMNEVIRQAGQDRAARHFRDYTVAHFSWDKMVQAYFTLFKSLAGPGSS